MFKNRGDAMLDKAHEGLDRGQAGIAGTGAVVRTASRWARNSITSAASSCSRKAGRGHIEPIACELQEQLKAVGITLAGVRARATLQGKPLPKERGEMRAIGVMGSLLA